MAATSTSTHLWPVLLGSSRRSVCHPDTCLQHRSKPLRSEQFSDCPGLSHLWLWSSACWFSPKLSVLYSEATPEGSLPKGPKGNRDLSQKREWIGDSKIKIYLLEYDWIWSLGQEVKSIFQIWHAWHLSQLFTQQSQVYLILSGRHWSAIRVVLADQSPISLAVQEDLSS